MKSMQHSLLFSGQNGWQTIDIKDNPDKQTLKILSNRVARWVQIRLSSIKKDQETHNTGLNELRVISSPLVR